MQIAPINNAQNYTKKTSFKSVNIHNKEYFSPFYKYATEDKKDKFENMLSEVEAVNTDLRIKDDYPEYLKQDIETYRKIPYFGKDYLPEFLQQQKWKYSFYTDKEIDTVKKKYNEMIESLGPQGKDLDIDIYPPPLPFTTQACDTVYVVPALGLEGVIKGKEDSVDFNTPYDSIGPSREAALPSMYMISQIKEDIFNKLNATLEEGLKNKDEKITISAPVGKRDEKVLNKLKDFDKIHESQTEHFGIKDEERRVNNWKRQVWEEDLARMERDEPENRRRREFEEDFNLYKSILYKWGIEGSI